MSYELIDNVKYFLINDFYIVGNNSSVGSGLISSSFSGEIVIQEKVNDKSVLEIGTYAFYQCYNITKITIKARIRSINRLCICFSVKLEYINIPSSVTFTGYAAIFLGSSNEDTQNFPIFIRSSSLFIDRWVFTGRSLYQIYYPSSVVPSYVNNHPFYSTRVTYISTQKQQQQIYQDAQLRVSLSIVIMIIMFHYVPKFKCINSVKLQ